ncbi:FtsX-like permease family protein [Nocardioidaceae bacterium]|nr:FtsX-like permease family protein [Nocardioidaceae bacterium]
MSAISPTTPAGRGLSPEVVLGERGELTTTRLIAGLSGAYGAVMIVSAAGLSALVTGERSGLVLPAVASVFVAIALYVATLTMTNAVATVMAGRRRDVALLRMIGADERELRSVVVGTVARAATAAAAVGAAVGVAVGHGGRSLLVMTGALPDEAYPWVSVAMAAQVLALVVVVGTVGGLAGRAGSRQVLRLPPAQAMSAAEQARTPSAPRRLRLLRRLATAGLLGGGALLLVAGMVLGESLTQSGLAVMTAFAGAVALGTGVVTGGRTVLPRVVAVCGRALGTSPSARIARRNAVDDPDRTTRSLLGLVVGVGLVTTFATGSASLAAALPRMGFTGEDQVLAERFLSIASAIMIGIVVISAVLSAVGFVATMSTTVLQRRREMGLLQALGFTPSQVRAMVTGEAVAMTGSAIVLGLALGVLFGVVGAQSLVGSLGTGLAVGVPWASLALIAAGATVLVVLSSRAPAEQALRLTPIEALRVT